MWTAGSSFKIKWSGKEPIWEEKSIQKTSTIWHIVSYNVRHSLLCHLLNLIYAAVISFWLSALWLFDIRKMSKWTWKTRGHPLNFHFPKTMEPRYYSGVCHASVIDAVHRSRVSWLLQCFIGGVKGVSLGFGEWLLLFKQIFCAMRHKCLLKPPRTWAVASVCFFFLTSVT